MAVNPTRPYILSSAYRDMKLWDWSKGWECRHSFVEEHSDTIRQVAFNPMDTSIFASASDDLTVKVYMGFSFFANLLVWLQYLNCWPVHNPLRI
uniref:Coatomer WD associated region domain-containing protein n=1 Tax=Aegilops tauschii subsp. strangulata TaxID=200361 RepID=A0A453GEW0_AEGTS